jgi:hypothetical protein
MTIPAGRWLATGAVCLGLGCSPDAAGLQPLVVDHRGGQALSRFAVQIDGADVVGATPARIEPGSRTTLWIREDAGPGRLTVRADTPAGALLGACPFEDPPAGRVFAIVVQEGPQVVCRLD